MKLPFSNFDTWNQTDNFNYLSRFVDPTNICPDRGLRAISEIPEPNFLNVIAWLGIFLSIEQATHVVVIFLHSPKKINFVTKVNPFVFPSGLALLWVFFTASSHILVGLTWRSNVAVLTKVLHVAVEATFLVQLLINFGFYILSGFSLLLVSIILFMSLTLPCSSTIEIASFSGIVLDSINYLSYVYLGFSKQRNTTLWLAIAAFGFHVLYLLSFIGVQKWEMINEFRGSFRLSGMIFNLIASEIFIRIVQNIQYGSIPFKIKTKDWLMKYNLVSIWTKQGVIIKGFVGPQTQQVNLFNPYTTGFVSFFPAIINCFIPILGTSLISVYDDKNLKIHWSVLCAFCIKSIVPKHFENIPEEVYVLKWNHVRLFYQSIAIIVALILAFY